MYILYKYEQIKSRSLKKWAIDFYQKNGGKIIPREAILGKRDHSKVIDVNHNILKEKGFIINSEMFPNDTIGITYYKEITSDNNKNLLFDF